jgi:hypothetical protein
MPRARLIREVFRPELYRDAVRRAVGGVVPGISVARERLRISHALIRDDALERIEPVPVIGLAGIGIAGGLRTNAELRGGPGRTRTSNQTVMSEAPSPDDPEKSDT